jgi:hypothetical protein
MTSGETLTDPKMEIEERFLALSRKYSTGKLLYLINSC